MNTSQVERPNFELVNVSRDDIPALLQVHSEAFAHDRFSRFMLQGRPDGTHEARMRQAIESWFDNVDAKLLKAVGEHGQVLGWVSYIVRTQPFSPNPVANGTFPQAPSTTAQQRGGNRDGDRESALYLLHIAAVHDTDDRTASLVSRSAQARIGAAMREDLSRAEGEYMIEPKFVVLQALATRPEYQRQGIGSRLVRWVVGEADADNFPCWVHASPAASRLYEKMGFVRVGSGEYLLGRAVAGAEDEEVYRFDFMKRAVLGVS